MQIRSASVHECGIYGGVYVLDMCEGNYVVYQVGCACGRGLPF
jgi:hypothetical protein